jgi:DNA-binding transcriptional ArsR family regulator
MSMAAIKLLLHPVRMRIVNALSAGRTLTTFQLCARMPEVSKATVYRHVDLLADGGILEVAGERQVRGAVERRYRLRRSRAVISAEASVSMSVEDHRRGFTAAMALLLAEFNAYLDRDHADPFADSVSYRQGTLWLSEDELAEMIGEVRKLVIPRMQNEPSPDRTPHLVSTILFPTERRPRRTPGKRSARSAPPPSDGEA